MQHRKHFDVECYDGDMFWHSLRKRPAREQGFLNTIACGKHITRDALCKFAWSTNTNICPLCDVSDSKEHRVFHCQGLADVRASHQQLLAWLQEQPEAVFAFAVCPSDFQVLQYRQEHQADWIPIQLPEVLPRRVVFTDGTCFFSDAWEYSIAAGAVVEANEGVFDAQLVARGLVPGLDHSAYRGEVFAVHLALNQRYAVDIYSDCDAVVKTMLRLLAAHAQGGQYEPPDSRICGNESGFRYNSARLVRCGFLRSGLIRTGLEISSIVAPRIACGASVAAIPTGRYLPSPPGHRRERAQRAKLRRTLKQAAKRVTPAISKTQEDWPKYVHNVQQHLAQEHQKVVEFNQQAHVELQSLRQELHDLTTHHTQVPGLHSHTYTSTAHAGGVGCIDATLIQHAVQVLATAGLLPAAMPSPEGAHMEVESCGPQQPHTQHTHMPSKSSTPAVASKAMAPFPVPGPTLPLHRPGQDTQETEDEMPPPGQWSWPPNMPPAPSMELPVLGKETVDTDGTPHASAPSIDHTRLYVQDAFTKTGATVLDSQVQHVVTKAAEGLYDLHMKNGYPGGPSLPQDLQVMLNAFAHQQAQCHHQMKQMIPANTASPVIPKALFTPSHAPPMSVASSPEKASATKAPRAGAESYSLSPRGQREQKIARTVHPSVHGQSTQLEAGHIGNGEEEPVPDSPSSPKTPEPVPTEVVESDVEVEDATQPPPTQAGLQALE
eukprot:Skav220613  [mRNA]  locus=scaffold507:302647:305230:- [translate_table: standard]